MGELEINRMNQSAKGFYEDIKKSENSADKKLVLFYNENKIGELPEYIYMGVISKSKEVNDKVEAMITFYKVCRERALDHYLKTMCY